MDAVFYWEMTYGEIRAAIEGNQKKLKTQMQIKASIAYQLGSLVGIAFNEPEKYPKIEKAFPNLFDDVIDNEPRQQSWQIMKARIEQYNTYLKQKRGEAD
ncbi:MAG: hypothetical protein PHP06_09350 [Clostridia bacterium]|nr:hypothetical protein [Clostridia bacterium]